MGSSIGELHAPVITLSERTVALKFGLSESLKDVHTLHIREQSSCAPEACDWCLELPIEPGLCGTVDVQITDLARNLQPGVYQAALFYGFHPGTGPCWRDCLCDTFLIVVPECKITGVATEEAHCCPDPTTKEAPDEMCGIVNYTSKLERVLYQSGTMLPVCYPDAVKAVQPISGPYELTITSDTGQTENVLVQGMFGTNLQITRGEIPLLFMRGAKVSFSWTPTNCETARCILERQANA